MARDILSEYGPDKNMKQAARATSGGKTMADKVDVMGYKPPQGPKGIMQTGVGLHGSNSGNTRQPTAKSSSGSPGLGGTNHGCCGSQGRH
jgi:hypothetical protein